MKQKYLIVVDMQNDFISGCLGTQEAQSIVHKVAEKISNWDGIVAMTQDTHQNNYLETYEGKKLPVPHCIEGTSGWEVNPIVEQAVLESKTKQDAWFLKKKTFASRILPGVLTESSKDLWIKDDGDYDYEEAIERIELVGVCTDICVISNAILLRAHFPETEIVIDSSCCAGTTPENHEAALRVAASCQITVI